jgi:hypothetical protein
MSTHHDKAAQHGSLISMNIVAFTIGAKRTTAQGISLLHRASLLLARPAKASCGSRYIELRTDFETPIRPYTPLAYLIIKGLFRHTLNDGLPSPCCERIETACVWTLNHVRVNGQQAFAHPIGGHRVEPRGRGQSLSYRLRGMLDAGGRMPTGGWM